jgi:hypothetical protein
MKKPAVLLKIFITGLVSLWIVNVNVGSLRCESAPGGPGDLQPQANRSGTSLEKSSNQGWLDDQEQEDKNERFKELEWLIKQRLLKQYERMETADYLEDNSD